LSGPPHTPQPGADLVRSATEASSNRERGAEPHDRPEPGVPVAFVIFVLGMSLFGVVIGVGLGIAGLILTALKFALMVILPIALLVWVAKRLLAPERTY